MRSVVERRVRTETLFDLLAGGGVAGPVGGGVWRSAQVAAEAGGPARLVVAIVYCPARGVGHGFDVSCQVVGLLNIVPRPPLGGRLPEVLPLLERSSERVVTIYRINRDIGSHFLSAAFLRPIPVETPFPIHRPVEDSNEIAFL